MQLIAVEAAGASGVVQSDQNSANQASAVAIADSAYYQNVSSGASTPPTLAMYKTAATSEGASSGITSVVADRPGVAKFEFASGAPVCVTMTTNSPALATC